VNRDGLADFAVGSPYADTENGDGSGSIYVFFGQSDGSTVDLGRLGATGKGYRIDGAGIANGAGASVANAGDVNGDGRPDLVVGAPFADVYGEPGLRARPTSSSVRWTEGRPTWAGWAPKGRATRSTVPATKSAIRWQARAT